MKPKSLLMRGLYAARDFRSRALFDALRRHASGDVLDVGGWDFFLTAKAKGVAATSWTSLENDPTRLLDVDDPRFRVVHGDGCAMDFADGSFDTVLNVQVLEHVFEPIRMVEEIARVLRPGGSAIFLIPQTSTTHLAPHYYGNFSRWWIEKVCARASLEIVEHRPLGGIWSSVASHLFYFFLQSARVGGMSDSRIRRGPLFYVLYPVMALYALVNLPICLFLSLGDLAEEPNNHLLVVRKPRA
ncbi:MAG: methyltransferase domain-containing protein [Planctomycetes bacterium]|nr:methyltransferase domain-containing protein [Planctomycetota bacterium]